MVKGNISVIKQGNPTDNYAICIIGTGDKDHANLDFQRLDSISLKSVASIFGPESMMYQFALMYQEMDPRRKLIVNAYYLPTPSYATWTAPVFTVNVAASVTTTKETILTLYPYDGVRYKVQITLKPGATTASISQAIQDYMDDNLDMTNFPFNITTQTGKLIFTAKQKGTVFNDSTFYIKTTNSEVVTSLEYVAGTGSIQPTDVIADISNTIGLKYRLYLATPEINLTQFETKLQSWQNYNRDDKRGMLQSYQVDTLQNLIALASDKNYEFRVIYGFNKVPDAVTYCKGSHLSAHPFLFNAFRALYFGLRYTNGADCSQYNATTAVGDKSNVSIADQGNATDRFFIIKDFIWDYLAGEQQLLIDNGITAFTNNRIGNLAFDDEVTTYLYDLEGNKDMTYHFREGYESVTSFLSYCFMYINNNTKEWRLSESTKGDYLYLWSYAYSVCSGGKLDPIEKRSYLYVTPNSLEAFKDLLNESYVADMNLGTVLTNTVGVILSQLREWFMFIRFTK
jgi:hypothetical protein